MRTSLAGLALSTMLAFGCSSGNEASAYEEACAEYAAAYCEKTASCRDWYVHAVWGDAETCNRRVKAQCLTTLAAPGTSRTADSTLRCANATTGVSCHDFLDEKLPEACVPQPGALADGAACADGAQCASSFCAVVGDDPCGVCAPKPEVGADCSRHCGAGLQCSESGKCAATVPIGSSCGADVPCTYGSTCLSGTCVKDLAEGAACDDGIAACDAFESLGCFEGECRRMIDVDVGATCGVDVAPPTTNSVGFVFCASSGGCLGYDPTHGVLTGTCIPPAADGATCGGTNAGCLPPARCTNRVCEIPNPAACR